MISFVSSFGPLVRCGGCEVAAVSLCTQLVILDRVKQLGNVLLSGLIHLDHRPLYKVSKRGRSAVSVAVN